jgi:hypothetical protein
MTKENKREAIKTIYVQNVSTKPKGSVGWLIFWFIFTGIGAFIYYLIRDWNKE